MTQNLDYTLDAGMILKDSGSAVAADTLATVGGSTATIDLGNGYFKGTLVVDLEATPDTTTGDECIRLRLIGCNTEAFTTTAIVALNGCLEFGDATVLDGTSTTGLVDTDKGATGKRYTLHFDNQVEAATYRYVRLFASAFGTSPSLDYTAFIAKSN